MCYKQYIIVYYILIVLQTIHNSVNNIIINRMDCFIENKTKRESNYYNILGIRNDAQYIDIKRAYRKLSVIFNSDKQEYTSDIFKNSTIAFYILSNKEYRSIYDNYGYDGLIKNGIDIDDINLKEIYENEIGKLTINNITGKLCDNVIPDNTIRITKYITLHDVFVGKYVEESITRNSLCMICKGSGSDDGIMRVCKKCQGRRVLVGPTKSESGLESRIVRQCEYCSGIGINSSIHKCLACNSMRTQSENYIVKYMIPIGSENDDVIVIKQVGNINIGNDNRDDINITIKISDDQIFQTSYPGLVLDKKDIVMTLSVPLVNALCGISRKIILPDGETYTFATDTVTKDNDIFIADNMGLPQRNNKSSRGKLFIITNIIYPDSLTNETTQHVFELLKYFDMNDVENKTSYNELKFVKY